MEISRSCSGGGDWRAEQPCLGRSAIVEEIERFSIFGKHTPHLAACQRCADDHGRTAGQQGWVLCDRCEGGHYRLTLDLYPGAVDQRQLRIGRTPQRLMCIAQRLDEPRDLFEYEKPGEGDMDQMPGGIGCDNMSRQHDESISDKIFIVYESALPITLGRRSFMEWQPSPALRIEYANPDQIGVS